MKIGILGGGQLSRMLALAGIPLGFKFCFFEANNEHCVSNLGELTHAPYTDIDAIFSFIDTCDVITYENENIPTDVANLISKHKKIHPGISALETIQDRLLEKTLFDELDIPTVAYKNLSTITDLHDFIEKNGYPVLIKKRRQGYDGKGQLKISTEEDLTSMSNDWIGNSIVEAFLNFDREVSLIAVSDTSGKSYYYDICENIHRQGVLRETRNRTNDPMAPMAKSYIDKVIQKFGYVGCLAFEFFQKDNQLYANELASRVHNSGHWTIEGAQTSQFENHLRAIAELPMGNTKSKGDYVMLNLLGKIPKRERLLDFDGLHLHDYQKKPRAGRKVGHICLPRENTTQYEELVAFTNT